MTTHPADDQIPDDPPAAYREWVETRPPNLRAVLEQVAPTLADWSPCWNLSDTSGHYVLKSFHTEVDGAGEHVPDGEVTCNVIHVGGPGSRPLAELIPIEVFGVDPTKLVRCGCGILTGEDLAHGDA